MARTKKDYSTASKACYLHFRQQHPEVDLSFMQWQTLLYSFNYSFRDHLLESGERGRLPWGFGDFMVSKKKKRRYLTLPDGTQKLNLAINWKATRETGETVYHLNHHTEGYSYYWRWEPHTARFPHHQLWTFKASRITSRLLAHYLSLPDYKDRYHQWDKP